MKIFMIAALLFLTTTQLKAEEKIVELLSKTREVINFNPLNKDERMAVIDHAKILFSKLYVNFEHKSLLYKKFRPLQDLAIIENSLDSLSDFEFHTAMLNVFNSSHDYHTNYNLPAPYSCYRVFLPFHMRKTGTKKILISTTNPKVANLFPNIFKISPGDELISYNSLTPLQFIDMRKDVVATPTPDAALMQGIFDMYYRNLGGAIAPNADSVDLVFKKQDGSILAINVPWLVQHQDSCINPPVQTKLTGKKASRQGDASDQQMLKERHQFFKDMRKNYLGVFKNKSLLSDPSIPTVDLSNPNLTGHPDLSWKNISWKGQNIGWLQLTSFDAPKGVKASIDEVKKVLEQKLNNTSAIVIDLRGNYGGQISFAEEMAALFNPRPVKVIPFYIRANDFTLALYNSNVTWSELIRPYASANLIVGPGTVTTESELLSFSQVYFGKVVLLTNSECFSSCDLFSAAMKDNNHTTIYGTDHSTMGGGANVWPMGEIQEALKAAHLPSTLPQGISTRITGRHAHRISSGKLIEDAGVETDIVLNENDDDIIDLDHSSIIAKIFNDLVQNPGIISKEISLNLSAEKFTRHGDEELKLSTKPLTIDQVAVYKNNHFLKRYFVDSNENLDFNLELSEGKFGYSNFIIFGFSKKAKTNFPILRKSIITESLGAFAPTVNLDSIANAVMVNTQQLEKCNWIKSDNSLILKGPYCADGRMEAVESIEVTKGFHVLSFDMVLDSEPTFDFFDVTVVSEGIEEKLMVPVSDHTEGHFDYDLSKFSGKKIDIRFRLSSDEASSGNGIIISNLKIN